MEAKGGGLASASNAPGNRPEPAMDMDGHVVITMLAQPNRRGNNFIINTAGRAVTCKMVSLKPPRGDLKRCCKC